MVNTEWPTAGSEDTIRRLIRLPRTDPYFTKIPVQGRPVSEVDHAPAARQEPGALRGIRRSLGAAPNKKAAARGRQAFMSRTCRGLCLCCTFVDSE
jgi:hypothetical protein